MASTSRLKTWVAGDQLLASDLNAEFDNILTTHDQNIGTPRSATWDMDGFALIMSANGVTTLTDDTGGRLDLAIGLGGANLFRWDATVTTPITGLDIIFGETTIPVQIAATGETNVSVNIVPNGDGDLQVQGGSMSPLAWQVYGA